MVVKSNREEHAMSKLIFVNLPVTNLEKSIAFYEAVGGQKNEQFSDETAACMVFSETIHAMLLTHDKFSQFTSRRIANAKETCQVLIAVSADSREDVDAVIGKAGSAGGIKDPNPKQDYGFMYGRDLADPDGHVWGPFWMDPAAMPAG
jgi:predicted lactoylglutathione lyase